METYIIRRDNDRDLQFTGELVAGISSKPNDSGPKPDVRDESQAGRTDLSGGHRGNGCCRRRERPAGRCGMQGRWAELALYRTQGGKYICEQIGRTEREGERDRRSAAVCEDHEGVINFFGAGWLAKDLYAKAGIDITTHVD